MRALFPALLLLVSAAQAQPERFGVDPRVELMSIVFRLAGSNEYTQGSLPAYNTAIDRHFAQYRDHDAIRLARELRKNDGVSYDAVMSMAVHIKDVDSVAERVPFDKAASLDQRWHGAKARVFLEALRKFAAESDFKGFLKSQEPLYGITNQRLRAFIAESADLAWFDRFFGGRDHAPFYVVPGLVNGGSSYGAHVALESGVDEIYAIPGVWKIDAAAMPEFEKNWTSTLVHEFAHSYVGPLIDKYAVQLAPTGEKLFKATAEDMQRQAYGGGKTVLYESLVRAAAARYSFEHDGAEAGARAVNYERGRAFLWTGDLYAALGKYAADREHYPTLMSFMPDMVKCFQAAAARADMMVKEYEASRPKVVSMNIANGAADVDPGLKELVINFDRPMDRKRLAIARTGPLPQPKMAKPAFDETGQVLTVQITLEPDKEYAFSLNWPGGGSFQSRDGVLLRAVEVKFRTKPAP